MSTLPDPRAALDAAAAEAAFGDILDGRVDDAATHDFLLGITLRDETASEIAGATRALRARMIHVRAPAGAIDVCGTGGDGAHSLNISTAVAIVVAACGVPVAKHGNRAASSKAGAADTLEALGLDLDRASDSAEDSLNALGIAFLFAQKHHPALGRLAPIRRAIGRRTILNLLGPLANPAAVTRQLVGVARVDYLPTVAAALALLGSDAALLVSGVDNLDELSIAGPSRALAIGPCGPPEQTIMPEDCGLTRHPLDSLRGGDPAFNAAALVALLDGAPGAYRDAVILNTAGALIVAGVAANWRAGAALATAAIDDGRAAALLEAWLAF